MGRHTGRGPRWMLAVWVGLCGVAMSSSAGAGMTVGNAPNAPTEVAAPQAWAVVIGINEYEQFPRLKYAVADAKAMAALFEQQGFQVTPLFDRDATRQRVLRTLGDELIAKVKPGDRIMIYFSGQGDKHKAAGGQERAFLIPVDGKPDALTETAVSIDLLKELADALPAKHVLFLVDACYARVPGVTVESPPQRSNTYLELITRERGRQLITAGGPAQLVLDAPDLHHGLFTYYLLEGIGGGLADYNHDGIVHTSELYAYLDNVVPSAALTHGVGQRPALYSLSTEQGEFAFVSKDAAAAGSTHDLPEWVLGRAQHKEWVYGVGGSSGWFESEREAYFEALAALARSVTTFVAQGKPASPPNVSEYEKDAFLREFHKLNYSTFPVWRIARG